MFYSDIGKLMCTKRWDIAVVMGDFNSRIGIGSEIGMVGNYELGSIDIFRAAVSKPLAIWMINFSREMAT